MSVARIAEQTAVIRLEGDVADVFPLFGPLREREWAQGWNPLVVWPPDEVVRTRMVFVVRPSHSHGQDTTWVVSRYDEDEALIEYSVFSSETVRWILIRCRPTEGGNATQAEITYSYVGTSDQACARNQQDLEAKFRHGLKDWEHAINHYLQTGERLSHHS